jgi:hypothetical protein
VATGGVVFHAATGIDADAIAAVKERVRRRSLRVFVRRGLLPGDDAQAMGHWEYGGGFCVEGSVRIEAADRAGASGCCAIAPGRRSPWTGCANWIPSACSTRARSPVRAGRAHCS